MGRRELQIRKAIEAKGYEVYDLHYERPGMHLEKGGQEGGWYGDTSYESIACWTFQDALDEIARWPAESDD